ncbi:MAG: hypothetical protein ACREXP_29225, partial [Steroidobacteraceae bacterium]
MSNPRLIAIVCCLVLTPLWMLTMFGRGIWTPDEPREADIVWQMSRQWHAIPVFAGKPFLEKPPLAYWAAAPFAQAFPAADAAM